MKRILPLSLVLFALAVSTLPCHAQYGWPPPGYSASSFVAPDGSLYRRLCQVLRERRQGKKCGNAAAVAPVVETPTPQPAAPAAAVHP